MKYLSEAGLRHLWERIRASFVAREEGKGLSSNDYTDGEKAKLASLEPGRDGATFTPSVSASGELSWTNDAGLPNPPAVNIRGPQGPAGEAATIGCGSTLPSTGEPGQIFLLY